MGLIVSKDLTVRLPVCQYVSMENQWHDVLRLIPVQKLRATDIAREAGISEKTVRNALKGRNLPTPAYKKLISDAVSKLVASSVSVSDQHKTTDSETLCSLETAKTERAILQETLLEDAALEMQAEMRPPNALTALRRLEQQVRTYGKRNHLNHKQLGDIVLVGGVLLELAWDYTNDDEPETVTESRAEKILFELFEKSNPKTAALTHALALGQIAREKPVLERTVQ